MNTLQSAWSTLYTISDRAWYITGQFRSPKALRIYRKVIMGAIATAAFFYALGMASRNVWEALKGWCDEYEMKCRTPHQEPEIIEAVEEVLDHAVALAEQVFSPSSARALVAKLVVLSAQIHSLLLTLQYRLRAIASPFHWQVIRQVVAYRSLG